MKKLREGDIVIVGDKSIGEITRIRPKEDFLNLQLVDVNILGEGKRICNIEALKHIDLQKLCALAVTLEE